MAAVLSSINMANDIYAYGARLRFRKSLRRKANKKQKGESTRLKNEIEAKEGSHSKIELTRRETQLKSRAINTMGGPK